MRANLWFWDWIANRYAKTPVGDQAAYEEKLAITQGYLTPESEVFEFGCGTGTTALRHAPYAKHIRATDASRKMIAIADAKAAEQGIDNVTFEQVDIADIVALDGSFDMVMGHSILHLLEDKDTAITRAFDLLKPGGVFVTSTVCVGNGMWIIKPVLAVGRVLGVLPLVRFLTKETLEQSMTAAGFTIDLSRAMGKDRAAFIVAKRPV